MRSSRAITLAIIPASVMAISAADASVNASGVRWTSSSIQVAAIYGATRTNCHEIRDRFKDTQDLLNEIRKVDLQIDSEPEQNPGAFGGRRIDRLNRKKESLQSQLPTSYPIELQERDRSVSYTFSAPRISEELPTSLPGLRLREQLEVTSIHFGGTSQSTATASQPELGRDAQGNPVPLLFKLSRDSMGNESLVVHFDRYLNQIDVCLGDLSVDITFTRHAWIEQPSGEILEHRAPAHLTFSGNPVP